MRSTTDTGTFLTHIIRVGWTKDINTSILAFDIAQFFSLKHNIIPHILTKAGFDECITNFFKKYLVGCNTVYMWNNFISPPFPTNVGVSQGSSLSPIFSALYLSPIIKIFKKHIKNFNIPLSTSLLSYVDDGLFISQEKSLEKTNAILYSSYNIFVSLLKQFGLKIEHNKSEVFHFSQLHTFQSPPLNLTKIGGSILNPKPIWRYLGFFFDRKLTFKHHSHFYAIKAISTIKCMKMLSNSSRGLLPSLKCLLYRTCILPIATYGFQLWHFKGAPKFQALKALNKMQ